MSAEIEALAKRLGEQADNADTRAKMKAFEGALGEISLALSDIVSALEKDDDDKGKDALGPALAAALKNVRIEVAAPQIAAPNVTVTPQLKVDAPQVSVNVSPTPIENKVDVPAPVVQVIDRTTAAKGWKRIEIEFRHGAGDVPTGCTLTRID
jgi:hypothetical protein